MDMPLHLANHLKTMVQAKAMGKTVLIEGVGIGPLGSKISFYLVNKMLKTADHIKVRTVASRDYVLSQKLDVGLDKDPAFDYLESRKSINKTLLPLSVNRLLSDSLEPKDEKIFIGINLRPLWAKYSSDTTDLDQLEDTLYRNIANAFADINKHLEQNVVFIFFPMNPDQYGFSDLLSAYKLETYLSDGIDFRIWEYEPGIDDMLRFLNLMDVVIAMRFHGCIFSLTQNPSNTIGLDYQIGKKGKVSELMDDFSLSDKVSDLKGLKSEWLAQQVMESLNANTARS